MSVQINFSKRNLFKNLTEFFDLFSENLGRHFVKNDSLINPEAQVVLKNPEDRQIIENAVQEMKNNRQITRKTITLSNNRTVTLSIE